MTVVQTVLLGVVASLIASVIVIAVRERLVTAVRYAGKSGDYVVTDLEYETSFADVGAETCDVETTITYGLRGLVEECRSFYVRFASSTSIVDIEFWRPDGTTVPTREIRRDGEASASHQRHYPDIVLEKGDEQFICSSYTLQEFSLDAVNHLFYDCSKSFDEFRWTIEMPFELYERSPAFFANKQSGGSEEAVEMTETVVNAEEVVRFEIVVEGPSHPPAQINFFWTMASDRTTIECPCCSETIPEDVVEERTFTCERCDTGGMTNSGRPVKPAP